MSRVDGVDGDVEVQTPLFRAANPFLLSIRAEADGECPTLRDVVERHPHLTVDDVKRLNPHVAAGNSATPLEAGVELRTPTFLTMRGQPYGLRFRIHDAEAHILACEEQLNALLRTHNNNEEEKEVLPQRRVLSQLEEVAMLALSEAKRQLPLIEEEIKKSPAVKKHLRHHVVVDAIKEKQKQLADTFSAPSLPLASFHHRGWVVGGAEDENHLTAANITTRTDEEEDFCMQHNTRWEFTFCRSQSLEEAETWAVLSCQRLTALMDALVCSSTHMWPNSRVDAAFMFVGDVFFVDDRHKGREGYEDATNNIRHFDPLRRAVVDEADIIDVDGEGAPSASSSSPRFHPYFARCEVRSAHNTTFGELCVKFGEYGVLRHCGGCDHYFHLSANQSLREMPRRERQEYPHRVKKRRDRVVRCHLCRQLPSTIALYQDELAAQNPSLLCPACCEILHGGDTAEERNAYIKVEVKEAGDYFVL